EDGIRDRNVTGVQTCALPISPTVQVTTRYPGASARTVIDAVALPIEQQVNGVEGMIYMQSFSGADGTYSLTVTFKIGVDLNIARSEERRVGKEGRTWWWAGQ